MLFKFKVSFLRLMIYLLFEMNKILLSRNNILYIFEVSRLFESILNAYKDFDNYFDLTRSLFTE